VYPRLLNCPAIASCLDDGDHTSEVKRSGVGDSFMPRVNLGWSIFKHDLRDFLNFIIYVNEIAKYTSAREVWSVCIDEGRDEVELKDIRWMERYVALSPYSTVNEPAA
jgi:hypothetical protein